MYTGDKRKSTCRFLLMICICAVLLAGCRRADQTDTAVQTESAVQTQEEAEVQTETETTVQTETVLTPESETNAQSQSERVPENSFAWEDVFSPEFVPPYSSEPSVEINGNVPFFTEEDLQVSESFALYSELDDLGRCGTAFGCIGKDLQPEGEREPNDDIHPSGMRNNTYDFVDKLFLYNRCHLIAYSIAGSNGDPRNLITGTRYMNTKGMLPYENKVLRYIEKTGNHVMYRVTPIFEGENLVASGVLMEAYSLEDAGGGLMYCVYTYNVQPGVKIDYLTGENEADGTYTHESEVSEEDCKYIVNTRTEKIHLPSCESVKTMSPLNKMPTNESLEDLKKKGYEPCHNCLPGQ